jgi:dipeptide/tripeptide permease
MLALVALIAAVLGFLAEEVVEAHNVFGISAVGWLLVAVAFLAAHLLLGWVGPPVPRRNP